MVKYYKEIINYIEEKDKVINEAIKYINNQKKYDKYKNYIKIEWNCDGWKLSEILERGEN